MLSSNTLEKGGPSPKPNRKTRNIIAVAILIAAAAGAGILAYLLLTRDGETPEAPGDLITTPPLSALAIGEHGGVATEEERCSKIGVQTLKEGGTAVDAAISSTLCIGVINSFSSGVGGGGFMVVRPPTGNPVVIDFRETAPAASTEDMFDADAMKSQYGGLAVAVPGEIRGLEAAHKKFGRLPWKQLFQPSIDLCENGFELFPELRRRLEKVKDRIISTPGFREIFTVTDPVSNQTSLIEVGSRIYRKNLGKTLRTIADQGASAFYTGPIAESMIKTIKSHSTPGIMTLDDLKNYTPLFREPIVGSYRGYKIITTPPPTSGPVLMQILNILEGYDLAHGEPGPNAVFMVEAMKWAFASRTQLGDPSFLDITEDVAEIVNKDRAAEIRTLIKNNETYPASHYQAKYDTIETPGTAHFSVMDKDNMAVAMTSTVNLDFGAYLMDLDTGIMLNNEMDDFSSMGIINYFGLPPAQRNFIKPGKRPLSTTVPTIIEGEWLGAFGGSGGSRILTSVAQGILNVIDYGMNAYEAVSAARVHHQLYPEELFVEDDFSKIALETLTSAGHKVTVSPRGDASAHVVLRLANGTINAGSDPRKNGAGAAAY